MLAWYWCRRILLLLWRSNCWISLNDPMRLCFATNNQHKVSEVRHALGGSIELLTLNEINCFEELPETMPTLEGNSLQKAAYVFDHYGIACFADDTGLEVQSLGGAPGVYSARYAGDQRDSEDNIAL